MLSNHSAPQFLKKPLIKCKIKKVTFVDLLADYSYDNVLDVFAAVMASAEIQTYLN